VDRPRSAANPGWHIGPNNSGETGLHTSSAQERSPTCSPFGIRSLRDRAPTFPGDTFISWHLSLVTIWTFSVSDFEPTSEKSPTADADRALVDGNIARSMGLWNESNISYDRAINDYDKIIEKDPINAQAWKNKAFAQKQLGRHNDSLKSYENYLELNKSDSYTWRVKAEILKDLGRDAEAEAAIAKANDIDIASVNL